MKKSSQSNVSDNSTKLNFLERTLYKRLYSTLEKTLIVSYDIYKSSLLNIGYDYELILSYDEYCELINKKLKGV